MAGDNVEEPFAELPQLCLDRRRQRVALFRLAACAALLSRATVHVRAECSIPACSALLAPQCRCVAGRRPSQSLVDAHGPPPSNAKVTSDKKLGTRRLTPPTGCLCSYERAPTFQGIQRPVAVPAADHASGRKRRRAEKGARAPRPLRGAAAVSPSAPRHALPQALGRVPRP